MDASEFLKIPKVLPICVIPLESHDDTAECLVLFPSDSYINLGFRIEDGDAQLIRENEYVIFAWKRPNGRFFDVGLLGSVASVKLIDEKSYAMSFRGKARVRFDVVNLKKLATWLPVLDLPIYSEFLDNPKVNELLLELKKNFFTYMDSIFSRLGGPSAEERFLDHAFVREAKKLTTELTVDDPKLFGRAADAIMNFVNLVDRVYLPSILILRESRPLYRLHLVTSLLSAFNTGSVLNANAHVDEKAEEVSIDALVNVVLYEDTTSSMRDFLSGRVIGQGRPIRTVARAFNLAKANYLPADRPLLTLFCAGPTSVGKTELSLALSDFIWKKEKEAVARAKEKRIRPHISEKEIAAPSLVKVNCGMFAGSLSHGVSNLIGAPVGYVGSKGHSGHREPILSLKNFPPNRITVLLLDEIEKAFIDSRDNGTELMGILIEILDKAEFVNNDGDKIDFRRTVVVFTSNLGSKDIINEAKGGGIGFTASAKKEWLTDDEVESINERIYQITKKAYEKLFPPEFRNRIHRFVAFHFLNQACYREIINKEFRLVQDWGKKHGVEIELSEEAVQWILKEINSEEGVRKLRDFITVKIMEPIAEDYNLKKLKSVKRIVVGAGNGNFSIENQKVRKQMGFI
ncbi:MAG: ABC superfamily ATP binding cassette transporter ATPase [Parcubacteria group bacterium GW2011_GWB1_45_9]|nr:MAG: ABC superfamily ATP binding cassette transporter ATPase [Parcubacteria group bacterium GW2011_GWB1_45_9]